MQKLLTVEAATAIRDRFPGQQIAFAACSKNDIFPGLWGLSIVVKDEAGKYPVPHQIAYGPEEAMHGNADDLNDRFLGLTKDQAFMYVSSSMRGVGDGRTT